MFILISRTNFSTMSHEYINIKFLYYLKIKYMYKEK